MMASPAGSFPPRPPQRVPQHAEVGSPLLVGYDCFTVEDSCVDTQTLGRVLNARKTARPVMTAAGKYSYMAIVQMDCDPVPVPF